MRTLSGLFTAVVTLSRKIGRALFFSVSDTVEHLHRSPQVEEHLQLEEHLQVGGVPGFHREC